MTGSTLTQSLDALTRAVTTLSALAGHDNDNLYHLSGSHHISCGRYGHSGDNAVAWDELYAKDEKRDKRGRWTVGTALLGTVDYLSKGKADYLTAHEHAPSTTDFSTVQADSVRGKAIGQAYEDMPTTDEGAKPNWDQMAKEVHEQFHYLTHDMGVKVEVTDEDPYADVHEMVADVRDNHRLKVLSTKTTGPHPYWDDATNDEFRAVHDAFGHAATGRGFDRHGEEAAFLSHSEMFSHEARGAMATETRGQNSALIFGPHKGSFPPQKMALLPERYWNTNDTVKALTASRYTDATQAATTSTSTDQSQAEADIRGGARPGVLALGFQVLPESRDEHGRWTSGSNLSVTDYEGRVGEKQHITRNARGTVPTHTVANLQGVKGEVPGEHRNKHGDKWDTFKADIKANGITEPIFITVDPGEDPKISEGNHRRDAAVELGMDQVPVEIRYFGHAERDSKAIREPDNAIRASVPEVSDTDTSLSPRVWEFHHLFDAPLAPPPPPPRARTAAGHDVSDEVRGQRGRWAKSATHQLELPGMPEGSPDAGRINAVTAQHNRDTLRLTDEEEDTTQEALQEVIDNEWTTFVSCRQVRAAAANLVGFDPAEQTSLVDPLIQSGSAPWAAGSEISEQDASTGAFRLLDGLNNEPTDESPKLYRAVSMSGADKQRFMEHVKVGQSFDMPLASFTDDRKQISRYGTGTTFILKQGASALIAGQMDGPHYHSWDEIPPELRSADDSPDGHAYKPGDVISSEADAESYWNFYDEGRGPHEYISGGRFKVTHMARTTKGLTVSLEQLGTFDPDTGALHDARKPEPVTDERLKAIIAALHGALELYSKDEPRDAGGRWAAGWSHSTGYGMKWAAGNDTAGNVRTAKTATVWDDLPVSHISAHGLNATEEYVKRKSIDKVVSGKEPFREGYEPHVLVDKDSQSWIIDGHHRVAMHTAMHHDTMPAKVWDERERGPIPANAEGDDEAELSTVREKAALARRLAAKATAVRLLRNCRVIEPLTTKTLGVVATQHGGTMVGLDYKFKTLRSLSRKLNDKSMRKGVPPSDVRIDDALRYTAVFNATNYTAGVSATLASLEKHGYKVIESENYWAASGTYHGINTTIERGGLTFELQFHTPASFDIKEHRIHSMYEEFRKTDCPSERRRELYDTMCKISDSAETPAGVTGICCPAFHPLEDQAVAASGVADEKRDKDGKWTTGGGPPVASVPTAMMPWNGKQVHQPVAAAWAAMGAPMSDTEELHPERYEPNKGYGVHLKAGETETRHGTSPEGVATEYEVTPQPWAERDKHEPERNEMMPTTHSDGVSRFLARVPGSERPLPHVFRIMGEGEYQQAKQRCYFQSDERMNLADEGTVTSEGSTGSFYATPGPNRIVRLQHNPEDGWKRDNDGYIKTHERIPFERADLVSPIIHNEVTDTRNNPGGGSKKERFHIEGLEHEVPEDEKSNAVGAIDPGTQPAPDQSRGLVEAGDSPRGSERSTPPTPSMGGAPINGGCGIPTHETLGEPTPLFRRVHSGALATLQESLYSGGVTTRLDAVIASLSGALTAAGHDVSGEKREEHGRWSTGGGSGSMHDVPEIPGNDLTKQHPSEVDSALAPIMIRKQQAEATIAHLTHSLKRKNFRTGKLEDVSESEATRIHERIAEFQAKSEVAAKEAAPYVAEFVRRGGWTRAFLVKANGGHVHKDMACPTCFDTTDFGWMPEESGRPEEEIVQRNAAQACTVCYPTAPVEAREGAAAAKRATKCPASGQYSSGGSGRNWAQCKECGASVSVSPTTGKFRSHDSKEEVARKQAVKDSAALKDVKAIVSTRTSDGVVKTVTAAQRQIKSRLRDIAMYRRWNNPRSNDTGPGPWDHPTAGKWMDDIRKLDRALADKGIDMRPVYAKYKKDIEKGGGDYPGYKFVDVPGVTSPLNDEGELPHGHKITKERGVVTVDGKESIADYWVIRGPLDEKRADLEDTTKPVVSPKYLSKTAIDAAVRTGSWKEKA